MELKNISFEPIWSDSLGAKSSCVLVKTPNTSMVIDPGAAIMQGSFPASMEDKLRWLADAEFAVKNASKQAEVVTISHYHYDHFTDFDAEIYRNKLLLTKNPNEFINESQRGRAENFFSNLCREFGNTDLEKILENKRSKKYPDPGNFLKRAMKMNFGNYQKRKNELIAAGRKWFDARVKSWNRYPLIPELKFEKINVKFPEGREFKFGKTKLRFSKPLFHGIEYSKLGWVFATIIECGGEKLLHSSDLQGPVVEDDADLIIKENPDVLILDGPPTYLLPYMLNFINLNRALENMKKIIEKTDTKLILYDHHLPRDKKYKNYLKEVYALAELKNKKVITVAEYLGKIPKVLELT